MRDNTGQPLAAATVSTDTGGHSTSSNPDGSYLLDGVAPGTYSVTASKTGYDPQTDNNVNVTSGGAATASFNLAPASRGTISGYVRNATNSPISGATVSTNAGGYTATSAADGGYTLSNVLAGAYNVTASKTGYRSDTKYGVQVAGGQTATADLSLLSVSANLLRNPSFEEGFSGGIGSYWTTFASGGYGATFYDGTDILRDGAHSQKLKTPQPASEAYAGVYQVASTVPGGSYTLMAWEQAHMAGESYCGEHLVCRLGYDLTGGANFAGGSVVWTEFNSCKDVWSATSKTFTATGSSVTVFLEAWRKWAAGGDDAYSWFDQTCLTGPATAPLPPSVADDGVYQTSTTSVHATWSASDPTYGIAEYQCAVSSTQYEAGIIPGGGWQSVGAATGGTRSALSLTPSSTYYVLVKARNGISVWSNAGASDGITVARSVATAADAKTEQDGTCVSIANLVCSRRPSNALMFAQTASRTSGIMVMSAAAGIPAITPGTTCAVQGRLTTQGDARGIADAVVVAGPPGGGPAPLGVSSAAVGGCDFFYSAGPPVAGQKGSARRLGPNNVGLLVKVYGWVLDAPSGDLFHIDDGGIPGGLPVKLLAGAAAPAQGTYAAVIGIAEPDDVLLVSTTDAGTY